MMVVGAVGGSRVNAEAVAEREALIQRRVAAERELGMAAVGSRNTRRCLDGDHRRVLKSRSED